MTTRHRIPNPRFPISLLVICAVFAGANYGYSLIDHDPLYRLIAIGWGLLAAAIVIGHYSGVIWFKISRARAERRILGRRL